MKSAADLYLEKKSEIVRRHHNEMDSELSSIAKEYLDSVKEFNIGEDVLYNCKKCRIIGTDAVLQPQYGIVPYWKYYVSRIKKDGRPCKKVFTVVSFDIQKIE